MSSKDLIDLDDRDLIEQILENLKTFNTKVRLWQKLSSIQKVNFGLVDKIDFVENRVTLKPYKGCKFQLTPNPFVYFHCNHRTTLFKTSIQSRASFRLEIKVPQFVKIQEGRSEERKSLGSESKYSALIKLDGAGKDITVQILDISNNGAALGVPRIFFETCDVGSLISMSSKAVKHLNNRIAIVRNKSAYCPDPKRPNLLKYRLGLEIFKEKDLEEYLSD